MVYGTVVYEYYHLHPNHIHLYSATPSSALRTSTGPVSSKKMDHNGINNTVQDVDKLIEELISTGAGPQPTGGAVSWATHQMIRSLITKATAAFMEEPVMLEVDAPVNICGDIHGQYSDLLRLLGWVRLPPKVNYLLLGDYIDRGNRSLETICLLFAFKVSALD